MNEQPEVTPKQKQISLWTAGFLAVFGLVFFAYQLYILIVEQKGRMDLSDWILTPVTFLMVVLSIVSWRLIKRGRHTLGTGLLFVSVVLVPPVSVAFLLQGLITTTIMYIFLLSLVMIASVMLKSSRGWAIACSAVAILLCIVAEIWNPSFRIKTGIGNFSNVVTIIAFLGLAIYILRLGRLNWNSIQTRLTLIVMIFSIPLLIGTALYISSSAGNEIETQALKKLQDKTESLSVNVNTWLNLHIRSLEETTLLPGIISMDPEQQKSTMKAIARAYPNLFLIHTVDLNGMDIARSDEAKLTDYKDRSWFQDAVNGKSISYQVLISRTINRPALAMSAPIYASGTIVGVVGYTSELSELSNEVISAEEGGRIVYVVDETGHVVAHPNPSYTATELEDLSQYPPVAAFLSGKTGHFNFVDQASGITYHAYLGKLINNWGIITQQPSVEVLAPVREFQQTAGILITLGSLINIFFIWLAIRNILQPIGKLTKSVSAIGAGDLDQVVEIKSRDEIGILAVTFNTMTARLRDSFATLEQRVADRTQSLELAAEVGRSVSQVRALDIMLKDAAELIRSRFNLYYVQVYLTDERNSNLILKSGTGTVGAELTGRGHRLPMRATSINGRAAVEKHSIVVSDTAASATFRPNPLLPDTRSEMAIPLLIGEKVVGVLDLQSSEPEALNQDVLTGFEALAGQLAIAIQNAEFLEETQQARQEVESQASRLSRANWEEYLDAVHKPESIGYIFEKDQISALEATSEPALTNEGQNVLTAPIAVTGEPLGNLVVEMESETPIAHADILIANVARQVAQQIENLRLLETAERSRVEAENASRRITREGWKEYMDTQGSESLGYTYNLTEVQPLNSPTGQSISEDGIRLPIKIRDESIGKIFVQGLAKDDEQTIELVNAVAERLGAHIESLRQQDQTQSALEQTEKLSAAGLRLSQSSDLQEVLAIVNETLAIPAINRSLLCIFTTNQANEEEMSIVGNWWSGIGQQPGGIGMRFNQARLDALPYVSSHTPLFIHDAFTDEHTSEASTQYIIKHENIHAIATMPLFIGSRHIGAMILESEEVYNFTPANIRLLTAMAPQIATVLENRLQFERAQKQAERQSTLNIISQKIQAATSVEAVLQIAARELGHALGAPRTIAQLSIKDKK